jgi:hypothetical protein
MIVGILLMVALYFYERRLGPAALIPTAVLHKVSFSFSFPLPTLLAQLTS